MPHPAPWLGFEELVDLLRERRTVVLSGAGVSTESGIPDYRGPDTREKDHAPIQYGEFVEHEEIRRHYWARSTVGWPTFSTATPNPGHRALARLEAEGCIEGVITQNVDRLHQEAGSERVIELHGALAEVRCLDCHDRSSRHRLQERLLALNPNWTTQASELAPDGDAALPRSATKSFKVPSCQTCGGVLKPDVVFFGENTPSSRVNAAWDLLGTAEVLLVTGSSLTVYSGFRFVRGAAQKNRPIGIVNLGSTRGDELAHVRVEGRTGQVLPRLAEALPSQLRSAEASLP